jgi:two-component system, OmpR family, sensor histidine kinase KdpD
VSANSQFQPESNPRSAQPGIPLVRRGRLTIFFGAAPGVGKTTAMLQAALRERDAGLRVTLACVETHGSEAVAALAHSLESLHNGNGTSAHALQGKLDLDALLAQRPQIAVVDNLACANGPGASHPHRHQDVLELLNAGIDVYAALNVQNLSSRADTVRQIIGITAAHLVPDSILDRATLELVDLTPEKLHHRLQECALREGKTSDAGEFAGVEISGLTALREMALRVVAEATGRDLGRILQTKKIPGPWKSGHRLLVGVSSSEVSEQVIRWTRRLADGLNCPWIALYVETSPRALARAEQSRISQNLALARELGAEVLTTTDEDIARGLSRVSAQRNVTQIVVGKPEGGWLQYLFPSDRMLRRLVRGCGDIDVHVVPGDPGPRPSLLPRWSWPGGPKWSQYAMAIGMVLLVTLVSFFLSPPAGVHATALIFLLTMVLMGLFLDRGPTLLAATLCALVWDYVFLPPVFAFRVSNLDDALLLATYFVIAVVLGQLTSRNRAQAAAERLRETRATALYLLMRELSEASGLEQILEKAVQQTENGFKTSAGILLIDAPHRINQKFFPPNKLEINENEQRNAAWVLEHGQAAGKYTDNLSASSALYVPLKTGNRVIGVMGLRLKQRSAPTIHQWNLLEAFCQQISLALDRCRLGRESEKAHVLAESERLSKTLLDSMSHEIRTPLAAIKSATSNLIEFQETNWTPAQQAMISEIHEATERLNRLAGNVLDMTRLESGHVKARLALCDVRDLIHIVEKDTREEMSRHKLELDIPHELPLVRMDFVLMQQALGNLLSNAAFHTPPGTVVRFAARLEEDGLAFIVADRGPGIDPDSLGHVFEKFYRAPAARTGGTGLGLSLVKGFVEAQGGRVTVENLFEGGAAFTIHLPVDRKQPQHAVTSP